MQRIKSYCHMSPNTKTLTNNKPTKNAYYSPRVSKKKTCAKCSHCSCNQKQQPQSILKSQKKKVQIQQKQRSNINNKVSVYPQQSPLKEVNKIQPNEDSEKKIMKQIISKNQKYFKDKIKVCCTVKPTQYKLQLPSKTGHSIYKHDYLPKSASFDSFVKYEPYKPNYPTNFTTSYNFDYIPHPVSPKFKKDQEPTKIKDGPTFMQTHYQGNFKNWGSSTNLRIEPPNNHLFKSGSPFNGQTTYNIDYVPKQGHRSQVHIEQNYPIFTNIKIPKKSHYKSEYTLKPHYKEPNFKPKHMYLNEPGFNYNTQYKNKYDMKTAEHCKYSKDIPLHQLQKMIMNL